MITTPMPASAGRPPSAPARPRSKTTWDLGSDDLIGPGRRVLKLLGGGDRYEAYVAWDDALLMPIVAKVLRPHLLDNERARRAMARESDALERLRHPVLVRSFGSRPAGAVPHLALELLDGPRLSTLVRRHGPLSVEQAVLLARQLSSALHYVGHEGWVHLDVKPRNIIMAAAPRLIDLSVARPIDDARRTSGVGTAAYMAPEQIDPARSSEIGPPADVFGLGATLFEALTGRQAFPATPEIPHPQVGAGRPMLPDKTPASMAALIRGALDPAPAARPTAEAFHDALEDLGDWAGRSVRRYR